MQTTTRKWIPEIMYEDSDEGMTNNLPFVQIPKEKEMPGVLFMFGSCLTGEYEPGPDGEPIEITELELHQYANLLYLKESLTPETYDIVRQAVGLEPLKVAVAKGANISQKVRNNLKQ